MHIGRPAALAHGHNMGMAAAVVAGCVVTSGGGHNMGWCWLPHHLLLVATLSLRATLATNGSGWCLALPVVGGGYAVTEGDGHNTNTAARVAVFLLVSIIGASALCADDEHTIF